MEISYSTTNIYRWINSRILGGKDFEGGGWTEVELVEVQDKRRGGHIGPGTNPGNYNDDDITVWGRGEAASVCSCGG